MKQLTSSMSQEGNALRISGPLTIGTVSAQLDITEQLATISIIDLAQVEAVDSAAVSLLLAWLRQAQQRSVTISFNNIPDNLLSLARLYGVAEFLPLSPAHS
ncbi:MAG: STAS domain-containing protein [Gallionellaceae bacterium]|nr:STAS domain-containing protein [Gallionellaceae bacterium]